MPRQPVRAGPAASHTRPRHSPGRATLCIFTRPVVAGRTKTRLASRYGEATAARLAQAFLLDTYRTAQSLAVAKLVVSLAEPGPLPQLEPAPEIWQQGPGDLGERMTHAARRALEADPSFVMIIGSDAPAVPLAYLELAQAKLSGGVRSVLGPTLDGGYYLLGLSRCPENLLANLTWSTPHTMSLTAARLSDHDLAPELLPTSFDVDVPDDLQRLRELIDSGSTNLPYTAEVLRDLGHR